MARCWELRGCDDEMQSECLHAVEFMDRCPTKCVFANACPRPEHEVCIEAELIFDPTLDRSQVIKETCLHCAFYLKNGPRNT